MAPRRGRRAIGAQTQTLVHEAYPAIAEGYRAHDVSRCWLYFGLIACRSSKLDDADERFGHAERHWREIEKPLHIHRILLQRSWVDIFRGDFDAAPRRPTRRRNSSIRGHATAGCSTPGCTTTWAASGGRRRWPIPQNAAVKLEQAAELKVPAALAVDSVRHAIADADARMRWATLVSARMLAGAFAVAWEWENTELLSELVEYHCARGTFSAEPDGETVGAGRAPPPPPCPSRPMTSTRLVAAGVAVGWSGAADPAGPAAAAADGPDHARRS